MDSQLWVRRHRPQSSSSAFRRPGDGVGTQQPRQGRAPCHPRSLGRECTRPTSAEAGPVSVPTQRHLLDVLWEEWPRVQGRRGGPDGHIPVKQHPLTPAASPGQSQRPEESPPTCGDLLRHWNQPQSRESRPGLLPDPQPLVLWHFGCFLKHVTHRPPQRLTDGRPGGPAGPQVKGTWGDAWSAPLRGCSSEANPCAPALTATWAAGLGSWAQWGTAAAAYSTSGDSPAAPPAQPAGAPRNGLHLNSERPVGVWGHVLMVPRAHLGSVGGTPGRVLMAPVGAAATTALALRVASLRVEKLAGTGCPKVVCGVGGAYASSPRREGK
ncbi:uncharacterized protein LOC144281825 [Canis aureus]